MGYQARTSIACRCWHSIGPDAVISLTQASVFYSAIIVGFKLVAAGVPEHPDRYPQPADLALLELGGHLVEIGQGSHAVDFTKATRLPQLKGDV